MQRFVPVGRLALALASVATVAAAEPDLEWRLYLASTTAADRTLRWWDGALPDPSRMGWKDADTVYGLVCSTDGARKRLVTASTDQTVRVWSAQPGEAVLTLRFPAQVYGAPFSAIGTTLAVLPMDGRVVLIDVPAPSDPDLPAMR